MKRDCDGERRREGIAPKIDGWDSRRAGQGGRSSGVGWTMAGARDAGDGERMVRITSVSRQMQDASGVGSRVCGRNRDDAG